MNSKILTSPGVCVCIVENTAKVIQAGAWSELGKMLSSIEKKNWNGFGVEFLQLQWEMGIVLISPSSAQVPA